MSDSAKLEVGDKIVAESKGRIINAEVISVPQYPIHIQPQHYLVRMGSKYAHSIYVSYAGYFNQEHIWASVKDPNINFRRLSTPVEKELTELVDNTFMRDIESI